MLLATSQPDHARGEYAAALGLATQTGDKYQQARAHRGVAQACHADGARRYWQQALDLFSGLGTPEASQVREQLATAQTQGGSHQEQEISTVVLYS